MKKISHFLEIAHELVFNDVEGLFASFLALYRFQFLKRNEQCVIFQININITCQSIFVHVQYVRNNENNERNVEMKNNRVFEIMLCFQNKFRENR
jgi:hypothetical protein